MSVIKELYEGNIYPCEEIVSRDKEYREISLSSGEMRESLLAKLAPQEQETFEQWYGMVHRLNCMEAYANFEYGFRLGIRLFLQVVSGIDGQAEKA